MAYRTTILAVASLLASATQINVYHDGGCQQYAYTVYPSGWKCWSINGALGVIKVSDNAKCNFYTDTNCQDFPRKGQFRTGGCETYGYPGDPESLGSIACEA